MVGRQILMRQWRMTIMSDVEIAKLLNVKVNKDSGRVFLEMEVIDPVWKQRLLREWQDIDVKLVIEDKNSEVK